ncbi:MAG: Ig-like domain-containing protein [Agathobacter sp.]|nr:Ig-like domain-containing protein [Agathobacter sp.]
MKMMKRRIAIFLCMLMAFTTVTAFAPLTQETVQAKTKWDYTFWGSYAFNEYTTKLSDANEYLVVSKDVKDLSLSNILHGYAYSENGESLSYNGNNLTGVKYESKNPDIVSIDAKTGKITAKKTGTALIKATWKGKKLYGAIKVVKASEMKKHQKENKKLISLCKKINKAYDGKVTAKNATKLIKLFKQAYDENYFEFVESVYNDESEGIYSIDYYVYSVDAYKTMKVQSEFYEYTDSVSPFSTTSSNCFKIASLSGKGKNITATLSKKVSQNQLTAAQFSSYWMDESVLGKSSYSFDIYVRNTKTDDVMHAKATIKKDSKDMKIVCDESLKKGTKYELIVLEWYDEWYESLNWIHTGTSTFTAK